MGWYIIEPRNMMKTDEQLGMVVHKYSKWYLKTYDTYLLKFFLLIHFWDLTTWDPPMQNQFR
jgi:hypothetical protein